MTKEANDKIEMQSLLHLFYGCDVQVTGGEYVNGGYVGKMIGISDGTVLVQHPKGSDAWEDINKCMPVLRPITDFKEMDIVDVAKLFGEEYKLNADENEAVLKSIKERGWGAFDAMLTFKQAIMAANYFLSKRFDLYNWIEKGIAVDKIKIK